MSYGSGKEVVLLKLEWTKDRCITLGVFSVVHLKYNFCGYNKLETDIMDFRKLWVVMNILSEEQ